MAEFKNTMYYIVRPCLIKDQKKRSYWRVGVHQTQSAAGIRDRERQGKETLLQGFLFNLKMNELNFKSKFCHEPQENQDTMVF